MKKILSLMISIMMVLAMIPVTGVSDVYAEGQGSDNAGVERTIVANGEFGEGLLWSVDSDGVLVISGEGEMPDYTNAKQAPWDKYNFTQLDIKQGITSIGKFAFAQSENIQGVTIPDSVTTIAEYAFYNCKNLKHVEIPNGIKEIKGYAFGGCTKLQGPIILENLEYLGGGVFEDCESLVEVQLPDSITEILGYTFRNCKQLSKFTVPSHVAKIGSNAFDGCRSLESIEIPYGVTEIEMNVFSGCKSLKTITVPESVTSIGRWAFSGCAGLEEIILTDNITTIDDEAFTGCTSLKSIVLPKGLKTIVSGLFDGCTDLESIEIPEGVTTIEYRAFRGCENLKTIKFPSTLKEIKDLAFYNCKAIEDIELPKNLSVIGKSAFEKCENIKAIELPESVIAVEDNAFDNCTNLENLKFSSNMKVIPDAFGNCTSLKEIIIPDGVCEISSLAFSGCKGLKKVVIPDTVEEIGYKILEGCKDAVIVANPHAYAVEYAKENNIPFSCLNHTWETEASVDQEMSCTKDRVESVHCQFCAATKDEVVIPTEGHDYEEIKIWAPTCEEPGYGKYRCKTCGDTYIAENAPVVGCIYDTNYISVKPTCTEDGERTYICKYTTDHKYTEVIPAPGHEIVIDEAVAATCMETGLAKGEHCKNCEYRIEQEEISALGHKYDAGVVTKEPTTKEDGVKTFTCTACKDSYTEVIAKLEPKGVIRVYGGNRFETALKSADALKAEMGVSKFDTIIVASGMTFADALPGSYLAAKKKAPILLIDGGSAATVRNYINNNLNAGGTVYVLGGEGAVKSEWMDSIRFERLGGSNRYDTNLLILKKAGVDADSQIMVCTGMNFADSLSVSATGNPILLVGSSLTAEQKEFMNSISGENYFVIGGTGAVNAAVENECRAFGATDRIAGANRYTTSVKVAEEFFSAPKQAVLAYAMNFADGLSGGPLAYNLNSPLILTQTGQEGIAAGYTNSIGIKSGYVLGGPGLISDVAANKIF